MTPSDDDAYGKTLISIDHSFLGTFVIPDSVETIADYAFARTPGLQEIVFGKNVTEIGHHAFFGCNSLKSVFLLKGLRQVPSACFIDCISLTEVAIPSTVTEIKKGA
ncbi:MAG: leucine-rich repeat domain-containing protein [Bacteroidales bacterium]|nr:leucine-rich repeat domain-containing protein [Bacteroidales bacterium]